MLIQYEEYASERTPAERLAVGLGWFCLALGAVEIVTPRERARFPARIAFAATAAAAITALHAIAARRRGDSEDDFPDITFKLSDEQAITLKASLEMVEAAWVEWCASGLSKLKNNYAVRFEPAAGARGTEVHLSGGGSKGMLREELRRFKQQLETGEIPLSDGPGLSRPARPREAGKRDRFAEAR
jgi:hypothetical protein